MSATPFEWLIRRASVQAAMTAALAPAFHNDPTFEGCLGFERRPGGRVSRVRAGAQRFATEGEPMTDTCAICERPMPDQALVCTVDTNAAISRLAEIVRLHPYALEVARGIVRHGTGGGGKPASRSPGNDDARDALDAIGNALTTIAREIAETRGLEILPDGSSRPLRATQTAEPAKLVPVVHP